MFKILLNIKDELKCFIIIFLFFFIKMVLIFCVFLKFVLFLFRCFVMFRSNLKVNVRDINGNILIYLLIIYMVDFKKCFDVIEILIKNGVDIIIRCNFGYLFIDFFRMFFF